MNTGNLKPLMLCIETATRRCSVALVRGELIVDRREHDGERVHSAYLTLFIESLFQENGLNFSDTDVVVVSKGPGSFTGLRIGMMVAKGICYGQELPLISVNTLQSMAAGYVIEHDPKPSALLCPIIDARRMEVYYAVYDHALNTVCTTRADVIGEGYFDYLLKDKTVCFFGENIQKCRPFTVNAPNTVFTGEWLPRAEYMAGIALAKFHQSEFEDITTYEPYYLKDFVPPHPAYKIDKVIGRKRSK